MVRDLQERAARALPAEHVEDAGGWRLRYAPGCAWWVGSVQPHAHVEPVALPRRVAEAEAFYTGRGTAPLFQISPGACPDGLDPLLAERGYRRDGVVSMRVADTAEVVERAAPSALRVHVDEIPTRAWFDVWRAVHDEHSADGHRGEWEMLGRVSRPSAYVSVFAGDDLAAVGRAVADSGWAGVFSMATLPWQRGRGAAGAVLTALAEWAGERGAGRMYLQVEPDNAAALRVYERVGFREVCEYHYRVAAPEISA
ncbi:GNAT family N-acetyltransferase [Streptosporangiaceae bacterium NEAU-GS5]|nr:GNAT family N-acetyltransferase [Streptosporangiaceae bacterium NEAU-GS5]